MKVVFLGTGGTIPTAKRKHPAVAMRWEGDVLLFDCGEGVQTQIFKTGLGIASIQAILISHLHGDHVLGLPGLLMTMTQSSRSRLLELIGPIGLARWIRHVCEDLNFRPSFEIAVREIKSGPALVSPKYRIHAFPLDHTVLTLGYCFEENERPGRFRVQEALRLRVPRGPLWGRLQAGQTVELEGGRKVHPWEVLGEPRPGIKVVYAVDSRPSKETLRAASGADLLVHDAMFLPQDLDKAKARGHSTTTEAAELASKARVRRLILTHISPRYHGQEKRILREARKIFPSSMVAEDLMEIEILHRDGTGAG
ncbi:MAG: ribonuclease Z [Deltaproteobacteria bacterium]|nr:ribonuclease Z [Deltaproteobacteria bacterium]MBW2123404.1 ribonuclease Z [Deltaproteobacteria bacterium]